MTHDEMITELRGLPYDVTYDLRRSQFVWDTMTLSERIAVCFGPRSEHWAFQRSAKRLEPVFRATMHEPGCSCPEWVGSCRIGPIDPIFNPITSSGLKPEEEV